jgi:hypothetical protein
MITGSGSDNSSVASGVVVPEVAVVADTQGRLRMSKAQRRDILAALARSGESLPVFARLTGIWRLINNPPPTPVPNSSYFKIIMI